MATTTPKGIKRSTSWFEVDKKGLGQLLAGKSKAKLLLEIVTNSWDEDGVSHVEVMLEPTERPGHYLPARLQRRE